MRVLNKYVVGEFGKLLLITTLGFLSIFMLVEFVEDIDDLLEHHVPIGTSLKYFAYKLPQVFSLICPLSVLLAVLLSLGILSRHMEITAIKSGGISLMRLSVPLIVCGIIISLCVIFINEAVVPEANKRTSAIEMRWLGERPGGNFGILGLWLRQPDGIYNIRKLDINKGRLEGIRFYKLNKEFVSESLLSANSATWDGKQWVAENARFVSFASGRPEQSQADSGATFSLPGPENFSSVETNHELMSFGELKDYIEMLETSGYDTESYKVDLYSKITFPLVNIIMVLVGIPFALRTGRRGGIADGIAISVAIAFSFWIIFAISRSLGISGVLPPIVAAAFPNVLFLAIGLFMMSYVRE